MGSFTLLIFYRSPIACNGSVALGWTRISLLESELAFGPPGRRISRRHNQVGTLRPRGIIGGAVIVCAIGINRLDRPFNLVQQVGTDLAIRPVGRRYRHDEDLQTVGIVLQIQLSPAPALTRPVLPHLPFAFSKDLHPGGIDGDVGWNRSRPAPNLDLQGHGPTRRLGEVGDGQVHAQNRNQETDETFCHPVRQVEQPFQGQQRLNGYIGVAEGRPPSAGGHHCSRMTSSPNYRLRLLRSTRARSYLGQLVTRYLILAYRG